MTLRCAGEGECDETRLAEPTALQVWNRHSACTYNADRYCIGFKFQHPPILLIFNCTCQAEIDAAVAALGSDIQPRCFVRASGTKISRTQLYACPGRPNGIEQLCLH